jgi:hypothetical protein
MMLMTLAPLALFYPPAARLWPAGRSPADRRESVTEPSTATSREVRLDQKGETGQPED